MTDRKRILRMVWVNTGIVLAVAIIIIGVTWYFTRKKVELLTAELNAAQATEQAMQTKKAELPAIAANLPKLLKESQLVSLIFPNNPAQKELINFLQQNVEKAGADVMEISMDQPKDLRAAGKTAEETALDKDTVAKTQMIATKVSIRGGFQNLLAFTENMKRSNRFFRIMTIDATPAESATSQDKDLAIGSSLGFQLDGELYYTTEKLDIAAKFGELRDALKQIMAYQEPSETETPAAGLLEVKPDGAPTTKEEQPAK